MTLTTEQPDSEFTIPIDTYVGTDLCFTAYSALNNFLKSLLEELNFDNKRKIAYIDSEQQDYALIGKPLPDSKTEDKNSLMGHFLLSRGYEVKIQQQDGDGKSTLLFRSNGHYRTSTEIFQEVYGLDEATIRWLDVENCCYGSGILKLICFLMEGGNLEKASSRYTAECIKPNKFITVYDERTGCTRHVRIKPFLEPYKISSESLKVAKQGVPKFSSQMTLSQKDGTWFLNGIELNNLINLEIDVRWPKGNIVTITLKDVGFENVQQLIKEESDKVIDDSMIW